MLFFKIHQQIVEHRGIGQNFLRHGYTVSDSASNAASEMPRLDSTGDYTINGNPDFVLSRTSVASLQSRQIRNIHSFGYAGDQVCLIEIRIQEEVNELGYSTLTTSYTDMLNGADIRYADFVQGNYPYVTNEFSETLLKTKLIMRHSACWILAFLLASLMGCSSSPACIDGPESIRVYVNNEMSEYFEYEEEYQTIYSNLKCSLADSLLETAVDEDCEINKSRCIIFHYSEQQVLNVNSESIDPVERIFDELVFCYCDPYQGEIVLSLDGRLLSGTYRNKSDTWPL